MYNMEKNRTIAFIKGFLISGLVLFILSLVVFGSIFIFYLFTGNIFGGETIQEYESLKTFLFVLTILISITTFFTIRQFIKESRKYFAFGIGILPLLGQIIAIVFYIANLPYSTPFEKAKWDQQQEKPYDITVTLVKEEKLIGLTKAELLEMLGHGRYGDRMGERSYIQYVCEKDWMLTVCFISDKVIQVTMHRPMLCV